MNHFLPGNFLIFLLRSCLTVPQTSAKATSVCLQYRERSTYQIPQNPLRPVSSPDGDNISRWFACSAFSLLLPWADFAELLAGGAGLGEAAALPSGPRSSLSCPPQLLVGRAAAAVSAWAWLCFVLICPLHYVPELERAL